MTEFDIRLIGRTHPKADLTCEVCHGRGWHVFPTVPCPTIERCDICGVYASDHEAAHVVGETTDLFVTQCAPHFVMNHKDYRADLLAHAAGTWHSRPVRRPKSTEHYLITGHKFITTIEASFADMIVTAVNKHLGIKSQWLQKSGFRRITKRRSKLAKK